MSSIPASSRSASGSALKRPAGNSTTSPSQAAPSPIGPAAEHAARTPAQREVDAMLERARAMRFQDLRATKDLAEETLRRARKTHYRYGEGSALGLIALMQYQLTGDIDEEKFTTAIGILHETGAWKELAESLIFYSHGIGRKGDFSRAQGLLGQAIEHANAHQCTDAEALANAHLGFLFHRRRNQPRALAAFHQSLALYQECGASPRMALSGLGAVYRELKDFDKAIAYFKQGLSIIETENKQAVMIALSNVGLTLADAGRNAEAVDYLHRSLAMAKELGDSRNALSVASAIPNVELALDKPEAAHAAIVELFELLHGTADDIVRSTAYTSRADYYIYLKDWPRAIEDLMTALELAERASNIEQQRTAHQALAFIYKTTGDFERALHHHERYSSIVFDVMSEQLRGRIRDLEDERKREQIAQQNEIFRLKNIDLTQANLALHDLNLEKDRLITVLRHDLRNPISAVMGYANLLRQPNAGMPPEKVATVIEESGKRILALMDDVTKNARNGTLVVQKQRTRVSKMLDELSAIVTPLAESKEIAFSIVDRVAGMEFLLDPSKIFQVLTNLSFNSIKFTPSGKSIRIVAEATPENTLRVTVQDEGIGIPDAMLPHIFEGGTDIQRKGTEGESGSGMGLSIAKSIIDMHGGTLTASSDPTGTTIVLQLP